MVEASIIFPVVIAAVMAVLYIIIGLYYSLSLQTSLHLDLRKECGEITDTIERSENIKEFEYEKDSIYLRSIIRMEAERVNRINGFFASQYIKKEAGRSYLINESEIVRFCSVFKEGSGYDK